jgi:RimJ/RimL family protein N-acetyltransferase
MGHFQFTIPTTGVTSVGYVVKRSHQNQGMATEALAHLYDYLRDGLGIKEVKAWADTRNLVSHKLAKKLGMTQIELIKDADFFKGASSDEYVF